MKRVLLSIVFILFFAITSAQVDRAVLLEKLKLELLPQIKDEDYNSSYRYNREKYILKSLQGWINAERTDCDTVKEEIEYFYSLDLTCSKLGHRPKKYIRDISFSECQETYDFLEDLIKNNPFESVRCQAIVMLAWKLAPNYLPCILEYAKKDSLSVEEKSSIATALMIYGVYTSDSNLKEQSISILDEICYDFSSKYITQSCLSNYYKLGGYPAMNFLNTCIEQQKDEREKIIYAENAIFLIGLGLYDEAFLLYKEALQRGEKSAIYAAIHGLSIIGTEEALQLIKEQTLNENEKYAKYAKEVLKEINRKGSE